MIKTVSFAPPRQAGSRSSAKPTGAKAVPVEDLRPANPRAASGRTSPKTSKATAQTSLSFEFGAPDEPEIEVAAPEAIVPEVASLPLAARKKAAPQVSAPEVDAPIAPAAAATVASSDAAPLSTPKTAKKSAPATKVGNLKPDVLAATEAPMTPVVETPVTIAKIALERQAPTSPSPSSSAVKSGEVKAKRARVPKDLAEQYGEKTVVRTVAPPVEAEIVKKRLNKVERQARRELIKPSDDLMARLARASQISALKPKSEPRGKGWKFQCGRCGTTSYFETPGGLCVCGTIAVKD